MVDIITSLDLAAEEAKSGRPAEQRKLGEFIETVEGDKTIKRWRIPPCEFRGDIIKRGEPKPCCGGKLTVEELFACRSPLNTLHDAWSTRCRDCVYPKTPAEQAAFESRGKALPEKEWPFWAKAIAIVRSTDDAGVGDTAHRIIGDFASEQFSAWHQTILGEPCKCPERQAEWNERFPYRKEAIP